jgi:uncharacterized membrane protein YvbJ
MQFEKKTRVGSISAKIKLLIKIILICLILLIAVIFIDKIDFPSPTKKIDKVISNENFKIVK